MLEAWNIDPIEISISDNKNVTPDYSYNTMKIAKITKKGKQFDIGVSVKNSAEKGKGLLKSRQYLLIDGEPVSYKRVALAPGEEKQLQWTEIIIDTKGTHKIQVGNMEPVEIIVK